VAAAIATVVAYSFYVAGHLWLLRGTVGLSLRPVAAGFARATAAAAAMSALLLAFGTDDVALPLLILGAPLGVATYVVALLLVRAVTPAELRGGLVRVRALVRPGVS
jgi:hypothetical protein